MNAVVEGKPKRSHHKKKLAVDPPLIVIEDGVLNPYVQPKRKKKPNGEATIPTAKPRLPALDPLQQAIEAGRLAQEGNTKLARAIDVLREGLQTISIAEMDNYTKMPVSAQQLRVMAVETLQAAAALAGQNWLTPRNQVVRTRAGRADHDLSKNRGNDGGDYD